MKSRRYKVYRDQIYAGQVVKSGGKIRRNEHEFTVFQTKPSELKSVCAKPLRSMLFVVDEDLLADDLLFQKPQEREDHYPVLNITTDDRCLALKEGEILIEKAMNLSSLLRYYGYPAKLTYRDILRLRKQFFDGRFAKDHCELFGWKELIPVEVAVYGGEVISDSAQLKKLLDEMFPRTRAFVGNRPSVLSSEYFDLLNDLGDHSDFDILMGAAQSNDAFEPHIEEGSVKKLRLF